MDAVRPAEIIHKPLQIYGAAGGAIGRREGNFRDLPLGVYLVAVGLEQGLEKRQFFPVCKGCGPIAIFNSQYQDNWRSDRCPTYEAAYWAELAGPSRPFKVRISGGENDEG